MATYAQFKHVELYKIGNGKNRVPNAPKSSIGEIFAADKTDGAHVRNGAVRPRVVRDTPTRPRDTHSRLFGQAANAHVAPMVTDTSRSHIQIGVPEANGGSPLASPKPLANGHSAASTPSRASYASQPKRNPVTGDGVVLPPPRRRHPAASLRGADPHPHLLEPQPTHRYISKQGPPQPPNYYVYSTVKPSVSIPHTPYTLIGLDEQIPKNPPKCDPNSLSPQPVLDRHWPPFPAQHYLEPSEAKKVHQPLPPHAHIGLTSAFATRPKPDYKYNPVPSLDGPIDPYLISNTDVPPTLFRYEKDGPIPEYQLFETPVASGPHTLTGFPPIFHKHVPGYLYPRKEYADEHYPKTYYVDYVRQREMEGNPITGHGYKSMNGQINTVTSIHGNTSILHNRVPPGGYSSGLW